MNDKKSQNRIKKEALVAELANKIGRAKGIVFTNYQGLTHKQIEELKKAIKKREAEFVVAKNTLLKKALEGGKLKLENPLEGPTAAILSTSDITPVLGEIAKFIKQFSLPTVKFGFLEGKLLTGEELLKISTLPSRDVLIAQLVANLKSPISGLILSLNWNLKKLAMTINEISKHKTLNSK